MVDSDKIWKTLANISISGCLVALKTTMFIRNLRNMTANVIYLQENSIQVLKTAINSKYDALNFIRHLITMNLMSYQHPIEHI